MYFSEGTLEGVLIRDKYKVFLTSETQSKKKKKNNNNKTGTKKRKKESQWRRKRKKKGRGHMNETSMLGYPNINLNPTDQQQLVTGFGANGSTPGQLHMNMMALGGGAGANDSSGNGGNNGSGSGNMMPADLMGMTTAAAAAAAGVGGNDSHHQHHHQQQQMHGPLQFVDQLNLSGNDSGNNKNSGSNNNNNINNINSSSNRIGTAAATSTVTGTTNANTAMGILGANNALNTTPTPMLASLNVGVGGQNQNMIPSPMNVSNSLPMSVNINANNPLFHPHLEDPSLLNNPIWRLQLQLAAVSMQSLGQPNVYARQNAMKKYLANRFQLLNQMQEQNQNQNQNQGQSQNQNQNQQQNQNQSQNQAHYHQQPTTGLNAPNANNMNLNVNMNLGMNVNMNMPVNMGVNMNLPANMGMNMNMNMNMGLGGPGGIGRGQQQQQQQSQVQQPQQPQLLQDQQGRQLQTQSQLPPVLQQQQQQVQLPPQQQQQQQLSPQIPDASLSLIDKTKKLLMDMAVETSKDKPKGMLSSTGSSIAYPGKQSGSANSGNNGSTGNTGNAGSGNNNENVGTLGTGNTGTSTPSNARNDSTVSTPPTPRMELNTTGTPISYLQHQRLSQYNIDDDDEDELTSDQQVLSKYNSGDGIDIKAQLWHALDLSNLQIVNINSNVFKYHFLTRLYLNGNGLTELPPGIKNLANLRVLDLSHNRLTSLPSELGSCFQLKYLYFFDNLISSLPWEFGNLFNLQFLGCEGNPLDKQIIKILTEKSVTGLVFYLRDNRPEIPLEKDRKFIEINTDGEPETEYESLQKANEALDPELDKKSFTLLTYNTLCQHYATPKMYRYTPSWALSWDYRRSKLKEQILGYQTDIICLQEVESQTYEDFWAPTLNKSGYSGEFHAKTRAKTMQSRDSKKVDGCCIFYRRSKFRLVTKDAVDFSGAWMRHKKFQRTEDYLNRAMNKDNVALFLKLQHIQTGEMLWVVTTHLHWDPKFNDVKTFQVGVLLDHMETLLKEENPKRDIRKVPLLICGDFNSYVNSAVYELLSTGSVKEHTDGNNRDFGYMSQGNFTHHLTLRSSYFCIDELPFTNYTPSFVNVIDYIWYSINSLRIRGLLGEVDKDYVSKFIGFPNDKFPSDHIPLIARVEFMKNISGSRKV